MSLRTRPRLVIGPWRAGAGLRQGGLPPTPAPYPPPPQSRAPGKVSASARDSPWPLPSPRAPELRPPGRLLSEDPTPLTPGSAAAPVWGQTLCPQTRRRVASPRFEVTSSLEPWGTLGSLTHRGRVARSGPELRAGTGCRAVSTGTWGFLDFPTCRWRVRGWGAPSAPRLRAHSLEASAAVCRACPRRSSRGGSTAGNSFLFKTKPNKKTS